MKLAEILFILLLVIGVWSTRRTLRRGASGAQRSLAIRGTLAFWVLGTAFLLGFVFLPGKWALLLTIPAFMVGSTAIAAYRSAQARLRAEEQQRMSFEKMKRVN